MARSALAATLFLTLVLALPLAAQGPPPSDGSQLTWSLGLGVITAPRPYVGASNQLLVIPLLGLEYKRLYVQGIRAGFNLIEHEDLKVDARVRYIFDGLDPDDSPFLDGMARRDGTVQGGLGLDWTPGPWALRVGAFTDLLGRSDGQEVSLDFSRTWTFARYRWGLTPAIGVVWQSGNLIDYYYGVPPAEARPDRPAFAGQAAYNLQTSLLAFYRISERVNLIALVQAQRLDNEIVDSPIVDDRRAFFGLLGISYQIGQRELRGP